MYTVEFNLLSAILTHLAHIVNGKKTYFIVQQFPGQKSVTRRTAFLWCLDINSLKYLFLFFRENVIGYMISSLTGIKLAQKFREKWLLPPDKTGRSFIGWGRSQDSVHLSPYWKLDNLGLSTHFTALSGIFIILSWELTKKETNFTVDLFILTSKPIKWCKVTQTWVGQIHYIWTHNFIHIFLEIDNSFE